MVIGGKDRFHPRKHDCANICRQCHRKIHDSPQTKCRFWYAAKLGTLELAFALRSPMFGNPPFRLLFGAFFDSCVVQSGVDTNRDLEAAKSATVQRPSAGSGMRRSFEHPSLHLPAHFTSRHASLARVSHRTFTFLPLIVQFHMDTKEINTFFRGLHLSNGT